MNPQFNLTGRDAAAAAVVLIALRWLTELLLAKLNEAEARRNAGKMPDVCAGLMDSDTYRKSVDYTLARSRFGVKHDTWNTVVLLVILFSGVLPLLFQVGDQWFGSGIWGSATTLFSIGVVFWLMGAPWDYFDQFRLEERFGFNTSTFWTWVVD